LRRTSVIAVGELVLEQDKESAEVILHQALRAAADRDADDARGAQDRRDRNTELAEDQDPCNQRDRDGRQVAEYAADGRGTLDLLGIVHAGGQPLAETSDKTGGRAAGNPGRRRDQDNAQACDRGRAPAREVEIGKNLLD